MSAGILLRNRQIAQRFHDEFVEGWRRVGPLTDERFASIVGQLTALSPDLKRLALTNVESILSAEVA